MPREVSASSDFGKSVKSGIGGSISHFRPGGRWDKKTSTPTTGKCVGQKKQIEWQDKINDRSRNLLSGTYQITLHKALSNYLSGLSSSSRQTIDDIRSRQPTKANEAVETTNIDEGDWVDVQPMDDEVAVSGEGDKIQILLERLGA